MLKKDKYKLAIYGTEKEEETLCIDFLKSFFLKKNADTIYVVQGDRLYGIVCLEDLLHRNINGKIPINKNFTVLIGYNVIKAHEIFQRKKRIHKIPVVDEQGRLLGEYSRWNDMLYVARNQYCMVNKEIVKKILENYEAVYLAEPTEKNEMYFSLMRYLEQSQVEFTIIKKEALGEKCLEKSICIFLNEDERRGTQALYGIEMRAYDGLQFDISKYDLLADSKSRWEIRLATYKSLITQVIEEIQSARLNIHKPLRTFFHGIDDKATILLTELKRNGVECFAIHPYENEETEYGKSFWKGVHEQIKSNPVNLKEPWPKMKENAEFYGDLYQLEDYKQDIVQKEIFDAMSTFKYRSGVEGKYFNAQDGRRLTCFQPEEYIGTVYLVGLCIIIGAYVEDQHTIASFLQKKLIEKGYAYRVENYGEMMRLDAALDCRLQEIDRYGKNDIVVYMSGEGECVGIEGCSLEKIYERSRIPSEWVVDGYGHCNYKVNELIADSMFGMIDSHLSNKIKDFNNAKKKINFRDTMENYIRNKYIKQYFSNFEGEKYSSVGAIVMKGNPFHKGHRYLIELAKEQVDFLIIFVVEDDSFLFPFEERFKMIVDGTQDISNIMVVPNGDFIFSRNTFWEYYRKREDETLVVNAEYDINIFVDYIAKSLHITHRFVGEESKRNIIKLYNKIMKRILNRKGINYVEIPKFYMRDSLICSSVVRKYLRNEEYDKAFDFLTENTKLYLKSKV